MNKAPVREPKREQGSRAGAETSFKFFFINWSTPFFSLICTLPSRRASVKPLTPLHVSLPYSSKFICSCPSVHPDFNLAAGHYIGLYNYLPHVDCSDIFNAGTVGGQVDQFSYIMHEGIRRFILRKQHNNSKFGAWFSGELRASLRHKKRAHRKKRRTNSESWQQQFVCYRFLCKELYKRDRSLYICAVESDATRSSKCFWQYVRARSAPKRRENSSFLDDKGKNTASVDDAFMSNLVTRV